MKPIYKTWIVIPVTLWLLVFAIFDARAGEVLIGPTFSHLSQLDAGPPFNENPEDAVDHFGIRLLAREEINGWEFYGGVSLGRNFNATDCSNCWNDGGAEIDSMLFIGVQKKIYEF